jgi:hypothetical protein
MSQFYIWLLSKCCDSKIHNGLADVDRFNECNGCGNEIVDMCKGSYDSRKRAAENFFERHKDELYGVELQDVIDHHMRENINR